MNSLVNNNYETSNREPTTSSITNTLAATSLSISSQSSTPLPQQQQPQPKKYLKIKLPDDKKPKPVFPGKRPDIKADVVF